MRGSHRESEGSRYGGRKEIEVEGGNIPCGFAGEDELFRKFNAHSRNYPSNCLINPAVQSIIDM